MTDDKRYEQFLYENTTEDIQTEDVGPAVMSRARKKKRWRRRKKGSGKGTGNRNKRKISVKKVLIGLLIVGLICFIAVCAVVYSIVRNTADIDPSNIYSLLMENSTVYDQNGEKIEDLQSEGINGLRTNIPYSEIPKDLQNAFISIEDKTFWEHSGFNFTRLAGAAIQSVMNMEGARGTSTITQQLARNVYLDLNRNWTRKIREAYYTVEIEKKLSKEQILEAYLNTIALGNGAYGVQAAAQSYFSKDVSELTIAECAVLASMPKSPSRYAAVKRYNNADVSEEIPEENIIYTGDVYTLVYSDAFRPRQELVLKSMLEFGHISQAQYDEAMAEDIREAINPPRETITGMSSYFVDYVVKTLKADLISELGLDEKDASDLIYNGGLSIYSTLDVNMQKAAESEFDKSANFPKSTSGKKDKQGNIIDSSGKVMLYKYDNFFDKEDNFIIPKDDYEKTAGGDLVLKKGSRLSFFKSKNSDGSSEITIDIKKIYVIEDGTFYSYNGGAVLIPAKYKKQDDDKNLVVSSAFLDENPNFFDIQSDGSIKIAKEHYVLRQKVVQPQGAVVIIDQSNGHIKTMVGGRNIEGKMLFNRATNPHPPGSSIKPIGVYAPALAEGKSAATVIDDCENIYNGRVWPENWYHKYYGLVTLRHAVQQSMNVPAVKMLLEIGAPTSVKYLKDLGVTTIVESGGISDMNPAALALGGMTNGISPLEMTAAYATIANGGNYTEPTCYTEVRDRRGNVVLEKRQDNHKVFEPTTAYVMTDILKSVVTNGIAGRAQISGIPTAGKTGTTTNNYDAWFCGFTPYYTAAVWIGNDMGIDLGDGSSRAASLWNKIMTLAHKGASGKSFPKAPSGIITMKVDKISGKLPTELSSMDPRGTVIGEMFVRGTEPVEMDDFHVQAEVCGETKYLATPYCPNKTSGVFVKRPEGMPGTKAEDLIYGLPLYYCNVHNPDIVSYPIDPSKELKQYTPPPPVESDPNIDLDGSDDVDIVDSVLSDEITE